MSQKYSDFLEYCQKQFNRVVIYKPTDKFYNNLWIRHFLSVQQKMGEKWIDLEEEIYNVILHVSKLPMPCTNMLYEFLERTTKENRHGALFINPLTKQPPKEIKRAWNTAKRKAGIENFRFHDLRHTVATRLVNAGVPLPTVKIVMTHSDIATTMRYVHTPDTELFKAMEVLNSCNKGIIQNG